MDNVVLRAVVLVVGLLTLAACDDLQQAPPAAGRTSAATPAADAEAELPPFELDTRLPPALRDLTLTTFTGDLDQMVKRRLVRIGVTFNRTYYFIDNGVPRGVSYEYGQLVEERLNTHFKTGVANKVHVVFVPLPRDILLQALVDGRVDLVAAQVTVRPDLQKLVDFTDATRVNVRQLLVTGPGSQRIALMDDLSGTRVFARESSPYYQSLLALNERLAANGKPPVDIRAAPGNLEDDDLLEMVNAGLIPAVVADDYLANFWKKVLPNLTVHDDIVLRTGGTLAIPVRKNSPQLVAALNTFMGRYGLGTSFGNQIERRYLIDTKYVTNATSEEGREKFRALIELFRKYSDQYDVDFLLMAAQGYQESQLNQDAKSHVGAIGVMQVMPATGAELKVGDIRQLESNIHAGVKYMRVTQDAFFKNEPMDALNRGLFTFASYNAGPGRIRQLRREAEKRGLNPNVWFGNVEQIASERIGRETVTYVANIYKYYIAYRLVLEESERRAAAKAAVKANDDR
jgi:membrane-bound lytic murein transglycosylase MltF